MVDKASWAHPAMRTVSVRGPPQGGSLLRPPPRAPRREGVGGSSAAVAFLSGLDTVRVSSSKSCASFGMLLPGRTRTTRLLLAKRQVDERESYSASSVKQFVRKE